MELSLEDRDILEYATSIIAGATSYDPEAFQGRECCERCVEVPWTVQHILSSRAKRVLDVGTSLSNLAYLGALIALVKSDSDLQVHSVDIVRPERVLSRYPEEWRDSILALPTYLGDVRSVQLPLEAFDMVTCVSTIEHVGFDRAAINDPSSAFVRPTRAEDVHTQRDEDVDRRVLDAFRRTLRQSGLAAITVPMGKGGPVVTRDSLGLYSVESEYDADSWHRMIGHEGFEIVEERFFKAERGCWRPADSAEDLKDEVRTAGVQCSGGCATALLRRR